MFNLMVILQFLPQTNFDLLAFCSVAPYGVREGVRKLEGINQDSEDVR